MALTWTITQRAKVGKYTQLTGTVAFDSSYPTGGEDYSAGMGDKVTHLDCISTGGYMLTTDYTNKKIIVYQGDNDNASDAPGAQVPDTTDLSTPLAAVPFVCQQL
jgi:hypothetical protein